MKTRCGWCVWFSQSDTNKPKHLWWLTRQQYMWHRRHSESVARCVSLHDGRPPSSWCWRLSAPRCCRFPRQRRGVLPAAGHQRQPADRRQPGHHPLPAAAGDPREGWAPQAAGVGVTWHHLWRLQVRAVAKVKGWGSGGRGVWVLRARCQQPPHPHPNPKSPVMFSIGLGKLIQGLVVSRPKVSIGGGSITQKDWYLCHTFCSQC